MAVQQPAYQHHGYHVPVYDNRPLNRDESQNCEYLHARIYEEEHDKNELLYSVWSWLVPLLIVGATIAATIGASAYLPMTGLDPTTCQGVDALIGIAGFGIAIAAPFKICQSHLPAFALEQRVNERVKEEFGKTINRHLHGPGRRAAGG